MAELSSLLPRLMQHQVARDAIGRAGRPTTRGQVATIPTSAYQAPTGGEPGSCGSSELVAAPGIFTPSVEPAPEPPH